MAFTVLTNGLAISTKKFYLSKISADPAAPDPYGKITPNFVFLSGSDVNETTIVTKLAHTQENIKFLILETKPTATGAVVVWFYAYRVSGSVKTIGLSDLIVTIETVPTGSPSGTPSSEFTSQEQLVNPT